MRRLAETVGELTDETLSRFLTVLTLERDAILALPDADIDAKIGVPDAVRLRRYNSADWVVESVDLSTCFVHDRMGSRDWLGSVPVPAAASLILAREGEASRVWEMKGKATLFLINLPIIVLGGQTGRRIDDGSHRAVAAWLDGCHELTAFVGTGWEDKKHQ